MKFAKLGDTCYHDREIFVVKIFSSLPNNNEIKSTNFFIVVGTVLASTGPL